MITQYIYIKDNEVMEIRDNEHPADILANFDEVRNITNERGAMSVTMGENNELIVELVPEMPAPYVEDNTPAPLPD
jgi:hypothetical protein